MLWQHIYLCVRCFWCREVCGLLLSLLGVFFLAARLHAHESKFSTLSSYEMLLLNAVPWPLQLGDKSRCGVCSPLVGGIGFWARLVLLCRERSPLLWLWVWGGFELCTPLPPFLHPASQTPHTEQSWSGYRFGGVPSCRARGWKYSAWNPQMRNRSTSLMTSSIRTRGLNAGNPTVMTRSLDCLGYIKGIGCLCVSLPELPFCVLGVEL
jgi:hypothetical protein